MLIVIPSEELKNLNLEF